MSSELIYLTHLEKRTGLSKEKIKRCFAYYRTRGILDCDIIKGKIIVQPVKLENFIIALKQNEKLNNIKRLNCFNDYNEFLTYRYHPDVVSALQHKHSKTKRVKQGVKNKERVNEILDNMFTEDESITISAVCTNAGICPETARLWSWNTFIAQKKKKQKEKRILDKKSQFYQLVDEFLELNNRTITFDEVYHYLGIGRTVLWRFAPEITSDITHRLKDHNRYYERKCNYKTKGSKTWGT